MTTTFIESQGVQLTRGDAASPEVFTLVPQCISFAGPDGQASEIDVTTLDSTAKEHAVGLVDNGSIQFEAIYNPDHAQHQGLHSDFEARTLRNFKLTFTNSPADVHSFAARVAALSLSGGVDDVVRMSFTLRISGAVTRT